MNLSIDEALRQGIAAHKEGNIQEADRLYTAILGTQPKHPDANHNMGVLAVSIGKVDAALPFLKTALESNPKIEQFRLSYIFRICVYIFHNYLFEFLIFEDNASYIPLSL